MTADRPVLFVHAADRDNLNPQAKNVQNILAHWPDGGPLGAAFAFGPAASVLDASPAVELWRVKPDRWWRLGVAMAMQRPVSALFMPGLHPLADWAGVRLRSLTGRRVPIIGTIEGVMSLPDDADGRLAAFSQAAGHKVHGQASAPRTAALRESVLNEARHIIAISPFLKRMGQMRYGDKISYLPLGLDAGVFHANGAVRPDRPRVVCAGGVRAHKRPDMFLDLARRFPEADFVWCGDGDLRQPLMAKAAAEGVSNLSFPGPKQPDALAEIMRASDIFVLPSMAEGVPKVTQEAAACGLAQVVFGFFEAPSVVDGVNGYVVWDDDQFAQRLGELIADAALRRRMGDEGVAMAQSWGWETVAPRWRNRILDVIAGRSIVEDDA